MDDSNENETFYVNEDSKFWKHSYRVYLSEFDMEGVLVNADNESEALDDAIDYAESQGWTGLFIENPSESDMEDHYTGGNHGLTLSSDYLHIEKLD